MDFEPRSSKSIVECAMDRAFLRTKTSTGHQQHEL